MVLLGCAIVEQPTAERRERRKLARVCFSWESLRKAQENGNVYVEAYDAIDSRGSLCAPTQDRFHDFNGTYDLATTTTTNDPGFWVRVGRPLSLLSRFPI